MRAFIKRIGKKLFGRPKYFLYINEPNIRWVYKIYMFKVYVKQDGNTWVRSGYSYFKFLRKVYDTGFYGSITEQQAFIELL